MRKLNCDDVSNITWALGRFEEACRRDACTKSSLAVKAAKMVALLEIMNMLGLDFEDDSARHNAIAEFPELYSAKKPDMLEAS
jgi:hypothetical protein